MSLLIPTLRKEFIKTRRLHFWQTGWKLCCLKYKTIMFPVRNKWNLLNFQKFIFNLKMKLWRHRVQFPILIPVPKTFSPSTVNVRSKFWRFWKKREIFQKFDCLFDLMRRRLQSSILISLPKSFSPSTVIVRSKFWRIWKKKRTSRSLVFWLIFWDEDCNFQFRCPCRKVFRQARWMFIQKSEEFEKKSELSKIVFLLKMFLWTRRVQF